MKRIALIASTCIALSACAYSPKTAQVAAGSEVGGTGNISFSEEDLGGGMRLLNVLVSPGILETEGSMAQRMLIFATRKATLTCGGKFNFIQDPNPELRVNRLTQRSKVYVFKCG